MKIRAWLRTGTRQVHDGTCARFQCGNRPTLTATVDLPTPRALGPQQAAEVELRPLEPDQWRGIVDGDLLALMIGGQATADATVIDVYEPPSPWPR